MKRTCKNGHLLSETAKIVRPGVRICVPCNKKWNKKYRQKNKKRLQEQERKRIQALTGKRKKAFLEHQRRNDYRLYQRTKVFREKMKDVPCADCGRKYPPYVMDFDHIKGKKEMGIGGSRSLLKIREEIKKCQVVCANCHRIRTWKNRYARQNIYGKF